MLPAVHRQLFHFASSVLYKGVSTYKVPFKLFFIEADTDQQVPSRQQLPWEGSLFAHSQ